MSASKVGAGGKSCLCLCCRCPTHAASGAHLPPLPPACAPQQLPPRPALTPLPSCPACRAACPPPQFEALAGLPQAKKWKTSFVLLNDDGEPEMVSPGQQHRLPHMAQWSWRGALSTDRGCSVRQLSSRAQSSLSCLPPALQPMADWLAAKGLGRKALDALAKNAADYAAWQRRAAGEGEGALWELGGGEGLRVQPGRQACACFPSD